MTQPTIDHDTPQLDVTETTAHERLAMVASLRRQLQLPPIAYSIDGTSVAIETSLGDAPQVGTLAVVDIDDSDRDLVVQVLATRVELREGPRVQVQAGMLQGASSQLTIRMRACEADGVVIGSITDGAFEPLRDPVAFPEALLRAATREEVRAYHAWVAATSTGSILELGTEPDDPDLRVRVHARGLARHTMFCGQSGSGKTFSLGVLLEQVLVETSLPMLVLDPNSDHVRLGELRERADADRVRARPHGDDAWERIDSRHGAAAPEIAVATDLASALGRLADRTDRVLVVDLGAMPDAQHRHEASAALLERVWQSRRDREPMLLVLDEAHDVCPAEPVGDAQRHATELAIAIAGEGRKFGKHLLVATQRPQKLHPNVVTQCDNLVLMRMNSALDIAELAGAFSHLPGELMARASAFEQGMALVGGPLAPHPMLVCIDGRVTPEGGADVPTTWAMQ